MKRILPYIIAMTLSVAAIVPAVMTLPGTSTAALPSEVNGHQLPSLAPMLEKAIPGVVNIATEGHVQVRDPFFDDPLFRRFFNVPETPRQQRKTGLGSGVIVDADNGYVVTNNHVIQKSDKITVNLHDGRSFEAKLIGTDPDSDIAIIQIPAEGLTALPRTNSDKLRVGDFVVAIGNPFGLGQTVTSGIVSALGRSGLGIEGYEDFIQTDASINPGNSGGALVNLHGELVGINTAILSRGGGNIGIGFAIPFNMVQQIMQQLIEHGEIRRGVLGVNVQDLSPELASAFGIDAHRGAVVTQTTSGSAAEKAGLRSGDIIVSVDGRKMENASAIRNAIGLIRIGQRVKLGIIRDGKEKTISAVIGEPETASMEAKELHRHLAGASLGNIEEDHPLYGKVAGVVVYEVESGSAAMSAGLRKGDIITSVNRVSIKDVGELKKALKGNSKALLLNIRRGNGALFLLIQ